MVLVEVRRRELEEALETRLDCFWPMAEERLGGKTWDESWLLQGQSRALYHEFSLTFGIIHTFEVDSSFFA